MKDFDQYFTIVPREDNYAELTERLRKSGVNKNSYFTCATITLANFWKLYREKKSVLTRSGKPVDMHDSIGNHLWTETWSERSFVEYALEGRKLDTVISVNDNSIDIDTLGEWHNLKALLKFFNNEITLTTGFQDELICLSFRKNRSTKSYEITKELTYSELPDDIKGYIGGLSINVGVIVHKD